MWWISFMAWMVVAIPVKEQQGLENYENSSLKFQESLVGTATLSEIVGSTMITSSVEKTFSSFGLISSSTESSLSDGSSTVMPSLMPSLTMMDTMDTMITSSTFSIPTTTLEYSLTTKDAIWTTESTTEAVWSTELPGIVTTTESFGYNPITTISTTEVVIPSEVPSKEPLKSTTEGFISSTEAYHSTSKSIDSSPTITTTTPFNQFNPTTTKTESITESTTTATINWILNTPIPFTPSLVQFMQTTLEIVNQQLNQNHILYKIVDTLLNGLKQIDQASLASSGTMMDFSNQDEPKDTLKSQHFPHESAGSDSSVSSVEKKENPMEQLSKLRQMAGPAAGVFNKRQ